MQDVKLRIRILGSGTSTGVPTIGCLCSVCTSKDPKNWRSRSSLLITRVDNQSHLVIDTTPDFRSQILKANVHRLENVLYTHTHADHCHGFDDLRAFYFIHKTHMNCYLKKRFHEEIRTRFSYAFQDTGYLGTAPKVLLHEVPESIFKVNDLEIEAIELPHGGILTTAYRIGSFAYATDFKIFSDEHIAKWKGKVKTMVASGLRFREHLTHSTIPETLALFEKLEIEKGYLTHLSHEVDYKRDQNHLPKNVQFAYDGLTFDI